MKRISITKILYMLPPLFSFLGVFLIEPMWNLKANYPTLPLFELVYVALILLIFFLKKKSIIKKRSQLNLFIIVIVFYGAIISDQSFIYIISFFAVASFAYVYSIRDPHKDYDRLMFFLISYISISIFVFVIRMYMYDFDFLRVRGGINIWGGGSLISVIYLFVAIQAILGTAKKNILIFSLIALILSLLFINRVLIIVSILLLLVQTGRLFSWKTIIFFIVVYVASMNIITSDVGVDFIDSLLMRFSSFDLDVTLSLLDMLEVVSYDRYIIWNKAIDVIASNYFGIGIDGFKLFSSYATPHNIILNNLLVYGVFLGSILNFLLIVPLFEIITLKISMINKTIAITAYFGFILNNIIAGGKLIQVSGYTSAVSLIFIFSIFNIIAYSKYSIANVKTNTKFINV